LGEGPHLYPPPPTGRGRILRGGNPLLFSKGGYGRDPFLFLRGIQRESSPNPPPPSGRGRENSYFLLPTSYFLLHALGGGGTSRFTLHA